jgi:hypothetical protein
MKRLSQGTGRAAKAAHGARRAWPLVLMAWERWQALPPEQKERYKRQARQYAERGRKALEERRKRG